MASSFTDLDLDCLLLKKMNTLKPFNIHTKDFMLMWKYGDYYGQC